jgi:hypothetical protein
MTNDKRQSEAEDLDVLAESLEEEAKKLERQAQQAKTLAEHPEKGAEADSDPGLDSDFAKKLDTSLSEPLGKLRRIAKSSQ